MIAIAGQPVALTIAGSDSSGGAGIQADLKAFAALGVHGASALTAVTAQNRRGVTAIEMLPPELVTKQIEAVAADCALAAVKTGMLGHRATITAVADALAALSDLKLIVDPVMVATSGARLLKDDSVDHVMDAVIPHALLVTPNLDEAAALLGVTPAQTRMDMERQALDLARRVGTAVLVTGGHLCDAWEDDNRMAADVLARDGGVHWFEEPLVTEADTHGTGCTLSAAITAHVARGLDLTEAITRAKAFVTDALRATQT